MTLSTRLKKVGFGLMLIGLGLLIVDHFPKPNPIGWFIYLVVFGVVAINVYAATLIADAITFDVR